MASEPRTNPTQLARDALHRLELLVKDIQALQKELEKNDLPEVRERLAVTERRLDDLVSLVEQFKPTKAESEEMGAIKNRITQLEEQKRLGDSRTFQFVVLFIGGLLTLAINIALLFLKK